jgi:hypothetical protein
MKNKIINNKEETKNKENIQSKKFINNNIIKDAHLKEQNNIENKLQINVCSSIENFEKELKKYYKYSSDKNYIKDNYKINGIDTSNKKNIKDNLTKLNTFDILNGEEEFNDKKNNNIMQFVNDLNQYIPQYKFDK